MGKIAFIAIILAAGTAAAGSSSAMIVDEGKLGLTHAVASGVALAAPGYPAAYSKAGDDVCIALGYTVKPDGSTGDFMLLQAWGSNLGRMETQGRYLDAFVDAAAHAVAQWRFTSKDGAGSEPVKTVATLTFNGGAETAQLADRCKIRDLAAHYRRLEDGRIIARRNAEMRRDAATLANIRLAESIAARRVSQPPSP